MKKVYLFQPQFTSFIYDRLNAWLPYSAAMLWSYASQFPDITDTFELGELFFKRESAEAVMARLDNPAVCGFSCYLWNRKYCLYLAEAIKQRWPDCVIIFGGADVNDKILKHKFIDTAVHGEGEESFVDILLNIKHGKPVGDFIPKQRLQDLDIPSPYLTGLFEPLIRNNPDTYWAVTLETNRGCPYACTFCDWGGVTYSKVKRFDIDRVKQEIEWLRNQPVAYLYVADANFGMFKDRDLEIAKAIREVADNSTLDLVSVQSAKQSTEMAFEIGQALGPKFSGVTVTFQSMNPDTLEAIKRKNLEINNARRLMDLGAEYNIPTYTEMILGLPNETLETWKRGMTDLLDAGQHNSIDMWFTQMLENSELNQPMSRALHGIKTVHCRNYSSILSSLDFNEIDEHTELIKQTRTMSAQDMVESYVFGWLILQFHIAGYSQILARYLNLAKSISYYDFYNQLFAYIKQHPFTADRYTTMYESVKVFLDTGEAPPNESGHMLHSKHNSWLYENKTELMDMLCEFADNTFAVPKGIKKLQHAFMFDNDQAYPLNVDCEYDIFGKTNKPVTYEISSRISKFDQGHQNYALLRRRGLMKNTVTQISDNDNSWALHKQIQPSLTL